MRGSIPAVREQYLRRRRGFIRGRRTHVEFHVRGVLFEPLLVHDHECDAVENVERPFILWNQPNQEKSHIIYRSNAWNIIRRDASQPDSIWMKADLTKVLGFTACWVQQPPTPTATAPASTREPPPRHSCWECSCGGQVGLVLGFMRVWS